MPPTCNLRAESSIARCRRRDDVLDRRTKSLHDAPVHALLPSSCGPSRLDDGGVLTSARAATRSGLASTRHAPARSRALVPVRESNQVLCDCRASASLRRTAWLTPTAISTWPATRAPCTARLSPHASPHRSPRSHRDASHCPRQDGRPVLPHSAQKRRLHRPRGQRAWTPPTPTRR